MNQNEVLPKRPGDKTYKVRVLTAQQPLYTSAGDIVDSYGVNDLASFVSWLEQRGLVDDDGNGVPPR